LPATSSLSSLFFQEKEKEKEETIDGWIPGPTVLKENECGPRVSYPSSLSFSSFSNGKGKERERRQLELHPQS